MSLMMAVRSKHIFRDGMIGLKSQEAVLREGNGHSKRCSSGPWEMISDAHVKANMVGHSCNASLGM